MRVHVTADLVETRRDYPSSGDVALLVFTEDGAEIQVRMDDTVLEDFLMKQIPKLRDWQHENDVRREQEQMRAAGQTSVDDFV